MEIEISKEKDNKLLKRREVLFRLEHKGEGEEKGATPSREEARNALIKKLQCGSNVLVIDWMRPEFGKRETIGYAKVYESEDRLKEVEQGHILERNFGGSGSKGK